MNKYRAIKTTVDGITFDSKGEAARWQQLKWMESAGEISDLKRQVTYTLDAYATIICRYKADFEYTKDGQVVTEDFKGMVTDVFKLKAKLFAAKFGRSIQISGKHANRRRKKVTPSTVPTRRRRGGKGADTAESSPA